MSERERERVRERERERERGRERERERERAKEQNSKHCRDTFDTATHNSPHPLPLYIYSVSGKSSPE